MPFFEQNLLRSSTANFDERKWVDEIRKTLDEEIEEETEIPVTIFAVPKTLFISDPNSYTPQEVAIGPYHHLRAELYDMETYKVAAAKRNQGELKNLKLQHIVAHLSELELKIRACYHRPVSFGSEALAWMMAVDVSFLFEFFEVCGVRKGKILTKVPSRLAHLISLSGHKTTHNAILRDIMMLENQIPLFVIKMLLKFQFSFPDEVLFDMLMELSQEVSPFKMADAAAGRKIEVKDCAHLLDFLYRFIVPLPMKSDASDAANIDLQDEEEGGEQADHETSKTPFSEPSHLRQLLSELWRILSRLSVRPMRLIKRMIFSRPVKVFVKLPWTILSKIPVIKLLKEPVERVFTFFQQDKEKKGDEQESSSTSSNTSKLPLLEEIKIPSVIQLSEVGVQFVPIHEGITSIKFDAKTLTFYIPIIKLDVNSEVVLRNLVAYEACSASGPLVLTRYIELMNGIIDTDLDARFLCRKEIIINHLKSEKEVADLWNGMSKSIRLTKVPPLDDLIGEVNNYYKGRWKVKLGRFMKKYVFASWRILTFLATILLLMLMSLQAFCQVYNCSRLFRIKALEPAFAPQ
ncbi:putative UPF0481 protein At3g02645 [Sesamum indicum]|uniref:UPF0481 protein At3g02645 n=1 Tax=Sesamum indicum TaxID=4182 RepID=A0A6I9SSV2_SESIN|nr:putative UPF0481 protein At3g02645 [Sesamum indicum]